MSDTFLRRIETDVLNRSLMTFDNILVINGIDTNIINIIDSYFNDTSDPDRFIILKDIMSRNDLVLQETSDDRTGFFKVNEKIIKGKEVYKTSHNSISYSIYTFSFNNNGLLSETIPSIMEYDNGKAFAINSYMKTNNLGDKLKFSVYNYNEIERVSFKVGTSFGVITLNFIANPNNANKFHLESYFKDISSDYSLIEDLDSINNIISSLSVSISEDNSLAVIENSQGYTFTISYLNTTSIPGKLSNTMYIDIYDIMIYLKSSTSVIKPTIMKLIGINNDPITSIYDITNLLKITKLYTEKFDILSNVNRVDFPISNEKCTLMSFKYYNDSRVGVYLNNIKLVEGEYSFIEGNLNNELYESKPVLGIILNNPVLEDSEITIKYRA